MCYEDPDSSLMSYLLDKGNWAQLANALNKTVLGNLIVFTL